MVQLFNHMTTNLIGASVASKITNKDGKWVTDLSDQEIIREAVHNLRTQIAVVIQDHAHALLVFLRMLV